jgi:hypothetical protein
MKKATIKNIIESIPGNRFGYDPAHYEGCWENHPTCAKNLLLKRLEKLGVLK